MDINEQITQSIRIASSNLNQDLEISLIEQLVGLVNNKIIEVNTLIPSCKFNIDNTKFTLSSAVGVRFSGKERIIELESDLSSTKKDLGTAIELLSFLNDKAKLEGNKYFVIEDFLSKWRE